MDLGSMVVRFGADLSGLTSGIGQAASAIGQFAMASPTLMGGIVTGATAVTTAVVGIGVASVKAAGDFESSATTLVTGAGESVKNLGLVKQGLLDISTATGVATKPLIDALYMIESAGIHGADGLTVLKVAAEGAKVGNADLGVTANALTTILTDYHMSSNQAASAMNALTTTVASGKTKLQDLASAMGSVLPLASSLGLSFPQVAGAIATMTNAGMSAQRASMNLANAIRSLAAPGSAAQKAMASVGLSAQQLKDTLSGQGLAAAIQLIEEHINHTFPAGSVAAVEAFKKIMGGATGYNVALMLGGKNMQTYKADIDSITQSMKKGGDTVLGWSMVQNTFNTQMDRAKAALDALMIKIGSALLPVLTKLTAEITPIISKLIDWLTKSHALENAVASVSAFISNMASVIKTVMPPVIAAFLGFVNILGQFFAWLQHNQTALQAFTIIAKALGVLIVGVIIGGLAMLAIGFATVAVVVGLVTGIVMGAIKVWQGLGTLVGWIKDRWAEFTAWLPGALGAVGAWFTNLWTGLNTSATNLWNGLINGIKGIITGGVTWLQNAWNTCVQAIVGSFTWLYNHNYYFQTLVDTIRKIITSVVTWLTTTWNTIIGWIGAQWQKLVTMATIYWNLIYFTIEGYLLKVQQFLTSLWNSISSWLQTQWGRIAGFAQTAWQAVSNVFASVWTTYIATPMNALWTQFTGWFSRMASQFSSAGSNFIQMLVNGITSGAGAIWNAVSNIASTIWKALGFHSPPEAGPAADSDKWMPNFVDMLARGLVAGTPKIASAANTLVSPLAVSTTTALHAPASSGATTSSPGAQGNITLQLIVDGQMIAQSIAPHLDRMQRVKLGPRGRV